MTKSQNLNVCSLILRLFLPSPLKPGVESRMKMQLEQCQHLSDQQFYCLQGTILFKKDKCLSSNLPILQYKYHILHLKY